MKKILVLTFTTLTFLATASCGSDDDSNQGNSLKGTAWFGTDDDEGEVYTFTTSTDFTFSGDGPTHSGTYTFNGSSGVLHHTNNSFDFTVSGDIMTVENGNSSIYIRQ